MRKWLRRVVLVLLFLAGAVFLLEQLPPPEKRAEVPPPPPAGEKVLAQGREIFDAWQVSASRKSVTLAAVATVMKALEAVPAKDQHYANARQAIEVLRPIRETLAGEEIERQRIETEQKLKERRIEIEQRTKEAEARRAAERKLVAEDAAGRRTFAKNLEHTMLMKGMDARIIVAGPQATALTIRYILMSRPLAYQLGQGTFLRNMERAGFHRVTFTDGYDFSWTYDLTK